MIGLSATVIIWLIYNAAVTWLMVLLWRSLDDFFTPLLRNLLTVTLLIWLLIPSQVPAQESFAPSWLIVIFESALGNGTVAWQVAEPLLYFWLLSCLATFLHYYFRRHLPDH